MGRAHTMTKIRAVQGTVIVGINNVFCLKLQTGIFHANMFNHEQVSQPAIMFNKLQCSLMN